MSRALPACCAAIRLRRRVPAAAAPAPAASDAPKIPGRAEQGLPARGPDREVDGPDLQPHSSRPPPASSSSSTSPSSFLLVGIPLARITAQDLPQAHPDPGLRPRDGAQGHRGRQRPPQRGRGQAGRPRRRDREVSRRGGAESLEDEARIKAALDEESARIVQAAEQEISVAAAQARRGLRNFAADLAIEQAAKQIEAHAGDRQRPDRRVCRRRAAGDGKGRTELDGRLCCPLRQRLCRCGYRGQARHGRHRRQFTDFLATWDGSAELRTFFANPAIPAVAEGGDSGQAECQAGAQKELRNLLAVLIRNDRIAQVDEVAAGLSQELQEQLGIRPAEIVTARELDDEERGALVAEVANWPARKSRLASSWTHPFSAARWCASVPRSTTVRVRGRLDRLKEALSGSEAVVSEQWSVFSEQLAVNG